MSMITTLIIMAAISTVIALGWGVISMVHGGSYDKKHSTQFMGARVSLQLLAIVLLFIALMFQLV